MNMYKSEYKSILKNAANNLKKINNQIAQKDIDLLETGRAVTPAFLDKDELMNEIDLHITYLGYIDALILIEKVKISSMLKHKENDKRSSHRDLLVKYSSKRSDVVNIIETETSIPKILSFATSIVTTQPSYSKFNIIMNNMVSNPYQTDCQFKFINSYNLGFGYGPHVNYEIITKYYDEYYQNIKNSKEKNNEKILKLKKQKN